MAQARTARTPGERAIQNVGIGRRQVEIVVGAAWQVGPWGPHLCEARRAAVVLVSWGIVTKAHHIAAPRIS